MVPSAREGMAVPPEARMPHSKAVLAGAALAALLVLGIAAGLLLRGSRPNPPSAPPRPVGTTVATGTPKPARKASNPADRMVPASSIGRLPAPVAEPARDQAVAVLMYHHVMPKPDNSIAISPAAFDAQMKYLKDKGFHPVSMTAMDAFVMTGKRLPPKPVLITFDDDRQDQIAYAVPVLRKYGFTATFFVIGNWVTSHDATCMHLSQLKTLVADGFDVQSHTVNHHVMGRRGKESYAKQKGRNWASVAGMKPWLEGVLPQAGPFTALAYPGGSFDRQAEYLVQQAGYDTAFTCDTGYVAYGKGSRYALPRWNAGARGLTLRTFRRIVDGARP